MSFIEKFDLLNKINDPHLGNIDLWKNKESGSYAFGVAFPSRYPVDKLKSRSQWSHPNIIEMIAAEIQMLPNEPQQLRVYFQFFQRTLQDYIVERHKQRSPFSESDIWFMIYSILQALSYISNKGYRSSELQSATIYLDAQNNVKIHEDQLYPGYEESQQNSLFGSPGRLLKRKNYEGDTLDLFSLGVVMLELCTLDNSLSIYDLKVLNSKTKSQNINKSYMDYQLKKAKAAYSEFLFDFMIKVLDLQEKPNINQILSILKPYEQQILKKQPLTPGQVPHIKTFYTHQETGTRQKNPSIMLVDQNRNIESDLQIEYKRHDIYSQQLVTPEARNNHSRTKEFMLEIKSVDEHESITPDMKEGQKYDSKRIQELIEESKKLIEQTY